MFTPAFRVTFLLLATVLRLSLPLAPLFAAVFHGKGAGQHRAMAKGDGKGMADATSKGARKAPPKVPRSLPVPRHGLRPARCACCSRRPIPARRRRLGA